MARKGQDKNKGKDRNKAKNRDRDFEAERIRRTMRSREHMATPYVSRGVIKQVPGAEDLARQLHPKVRHDLLNPTLRPKPLRTDTVLVDLLDLPPEVEQPEEAGVRACPRCGEKAGYKDGRCRHCGVSKNRPVRRA